jgi:hypothetical protein
VVDWSEWEAPARPRVETRRGPLLARETKYYPSPPKLSARWSRASSPRPPCGGVRLYLKPSVAPITVAPQPTHHHLVCELHPAKGLGCPFSPWPMDFYRVPNFRWGVQRRSHAEHGTTGRLGMSGQFDGVAQRELDWGSSAAPLKVTQSWW